MLAMPDVRKKTISCRSYAATFYATDYPFPQAAEEPPTLTITVGKDVFHNT